jgi:WD40 repeat protein
VIESAHLSRLPSIKASPKARPQKTSPLNSVTCVLFNPLTHHLYSSGANDATIKIWDLRKCRRIKVNNKYSSTPSKELYQTSKKGSPSHGFTSLAFNQNYRLFASCSNHNIYGYFGDNILPSITCSGHRVNNFTRISPLDANYLVSGSISGRAFIWSIDWTNCANKKIWPIYSLPHSDEEVTAVACDSYWLNIYSCSDDQRISKWSLFNSNSHLENTRKSEIFLPKETEIEVIEEIKPSITTPPLNNIRPFSTLTNWLETSGKQRLTPNSNPKRIRLIQSTPTNRGLSKENSKNKSSKRKLFSNNKKISDYFTP